LAKVQREYFNLQAENTADLNSFSIDDGDHQSVINENPAFSEPKKKNITRQRQCTTTLTYTFMSIYGCELNSTIMGFSRIFLVIPVCTTWGIFCC
jgi:hypothetical protein